MTPPLRGNVLDDRKGLLQGHPPRLAHFLGKRMQEQHSPAFDRSLGWMVDAEPLPVANRKKENFP